MRERDAQMVPPHSIEAEESVIGGILVHARFLLDVVPVLKPDDFYHPALRAIYEAMLELDAASKPVDALTVVDKMRSLGTFEKLRAFEGGDFLSDLMAKVVTAENIAYHARIVRAKAKRRRMDMAFRSLATAARADSDDEEYFADAERQMLALSIDNQDDDGKPHDFTDIMHEYYKLLEERYTQREKGGIGSITGIPTGYSELDRLLCGMQSGDLILLAGRPSMGKTSLAMNVAASVVMRDVPVLVFSLEMGRHQLAERALSGEARVDSQRLRHGDLEAKHWLRLTAASQRLAHRPFQIIDRGTITLAEMRSKARMWRLAHPVGDKGERCQALVVIDYLGLIEVGNERGRRRESRQQDVSEISRGLKQLAKDLRCPVLALSQLNRGLESRPDKRPMMSDLRDSGSLEQDADVVAFVYRDEVYSKDECKPEDKGVAEVIIRKQRMGPLATVRLAFIDAYTKFEAMSNRSGA